MELASKIRQTEIASVDDSFVSSWLGSLKPTTVKAYASDLRSFATWLGCETPDDAIQSLIAEGNGPANRLAHDYKTHMVDAELAAATINRRLSTLRAIVSHCRTVGFINWALDCRSVKAKKYRDTKGPGVSVVRQLIEHLAEQPTGKAARDTAIIRLMFDRGLRRGEVVSLDMSDLELDVCGVWLAGKGQTDKEIVTVGPVACEAISDWIGWRGTDAGPLFTNLDRNPKNRGRRLTGDSIGRIVGKLGDDVGASRTVRPHGLRHTAITAALDKTGGDYRQVQAFSRHAKIETVTIYDDNRTDNGGAVATLIAELI